jgi:hypothetical protein
MLSTHKIESAFKAICEEAENIKKDNLPDSVKKGLDTIMSIAKHQNDIRQSSKGSCTASAPERGGAS